MKYSSTLVIREYLLVICIRIIMRIVYIYYIDDLLLLVDNDSMDID